jgi:quercetin dioxygenase-like cupin family protein
MLACGISLKLRCAGIMVMASLVTAGVSAGADAPIVATPVAAGTLKAPVSLSSKAGAMVVEAIKIAPGGDFGWHTHGSAVAVVITGGTLTVWDPSVAACAPQHYSKGAAFIEPAHHLHRARNLGTKPVTLYATYLGLPNGVRPNISGTAPAACD